MKAKNLKKSLTELAKEDAERDMRTEPSLPRNTKIIKPYDAYRALYVAACNLDSSRLDSYQL